MLDLFFHGIRSVLRKDADQPQGEDRFDLSRSLSQRIQDVGEFFFGKFEFDDRRKDALFKDVLFQGSRT